MQRIIVLGVAGVGKTTACKRFVENNPNFFYLSASGLLASATAKSVAALNAETRIDILKNQEILRTAFNKAACEHSHIILDGQCVIDNGQELIVLPVNAVASLAPTGLVLLEDDPERVQKNRVADNRKRRATTLNEIAKHADLIRKVSTDYSNELGIPLTILRPNLDGRFALQEAVQNNT